MPHRTCQAHGCERIIPAQRRLNARYCSERCRKRAEHKRAYDRGAVHKLRAERKKHAPAFDLTRCHIADRVHLQDLGRYNQALTRDHCAYCGNRSTVMDHVTPISRGGDDSWDNLVAACASCNGAKGVSTFLSFLVLRKTRTELEELRATEQRWRTVGPPSTTTPAKRAKSAHRPCRNWRRLAAA